MCVREGGFIFGAGWPGGKMKRGGGLALPLPGGQRRRAMQFKDFLQAQGLTLSEVARLWGVPPSTLSRPAKGQRWPSNLVIVRAFILSEGAVGLADWIEVCRPLLEAEGIIQPTGKTEDGKSAEE